ncbi:MAG: hypothetical protein IIC73_06930 [Armatimonadetes bacterium]|nr:hypothetical protein [Armatimonadota bacterium]
MLEMTQPLATGNLADIREAIDILSAAGVPPAAMISTKRGRGGPLTALVATWEPTPVTDEPQTTA